MNESFDRRYVLALSAVALVILVLGAWLRPKKPPAHTPSPSDTVSIQRIVRREDLRGSAALFSERAAAVAPHVVYDTAKRSSGLYWDAPAGVLVPGVDPYDSDTPTLTLTKPADPPPMPRYSLAADSPGGRWILLAGRAPDQRLVWTAAFEGSAAPASCDGIEYRELAIAAQLNASFNGFGAFDLDGNLAGMVMPCAGSYHVVAAESIGPMLTALNSPERKLRAEYGLRTAPRETGLLVIEIWKTGRAFAAGLRAGDLILSANDTPASTPASLWTAAKLVVARGTKRIPIDLNSEPEPSPAVLTESSPAQSVLEISPKSEAHRAGLRTGDRILQAGTIRNPSSAQLRRVLEHPGAAPAILLVDRGPRQLAIVIPR